MATHENLAGGLLGAAGALFAAWIAYHSTQVQIRAVEAEARQGKRLAADQNVQAAGRDIDVLKLARGYLLSFTSNFPSDTSKSSSAEFSDLLSLLDQRALVYLSSSASNAPYDFGRRITTVMWRMQELAKKITAAQLKGTSQADRNDLWEIVVREQVAGARLIAEEIAEFILKLEKGLVDLMDQRDRI